VHSDSVAMDSPSASPAKEELSGAAVGDAGPCPRFVTNEELHILQTCLTRWRTEVEQDIKGIVCIHSVILSLLCISNMSLGSYLMRLCCRSKWLVVSVKLASIFVK